MYDSNERDRPKVSIIIPVYNVERYLGECLDSAIGQTLQDIEIICVNDGSTDSSLEILREYGRRDPRVKVIDKPNSGYGHTMNCGIEAACGAYMGILESDDWVRPDMYETLYRTAESTGHQVDFVRSDAVAFYGDGPREDSELIRCARPEHYNRCIVPLEEPQVFCNYAINVIGIYRMDFVNKHHIRFHETKGAAFQDNGFWFHLFLFAERIYYVDRAFYMYRQDREDSSNNNMSYENTFCIFREFQYIYDLMRRHPQRCQDYMRVCVMRCFSTLLYRLYRIPAKYRLSYSRKFSRFMSLFRERGELDTELLEPDQLRKLELLIEDYEVFHRSYCLESPVS